MDNQQQNPYEQNQQQAQPNYQQNQQPQQQPNYSQPNYQYGNGGNVPPQQNYAPYYDPFDHTSEFDPQDISDNKVVAMLIYILSVFGVIIAALVAPKSKYVAFHLRQGLKFIVVDALLGICTAVLFWTFIVPIAAGIMYLVLFVIKIITFFQIASGKAKEPAIIKSLGFLK